MRKILFGLFVAAVVLSNMGCRHHKAESTTTAAPCNCGQ